MSTDLTPIKVANAVGLKTKLTPEFLQFAVEMQALSLKRYADWCRASGDKFERITWADAAINAELMGSQLGAITVDFDKT